MTLTEIPASTPSTLFIAVGSQARFVFNVDQPATKTGLHIVVTVKTQGLATITDKPLRYVPDANGNAIVDVGPVVYNYMVNNKLQIQRFEIIGKEFHDALPGGGSDVTSDLYTGIRAMVPDGHEQGARFPEIQLEKGVKGVDLSGADELDIQFSWLDSSQPISKPAWNTPSLTPTATAQANDQTRVLRNNIIKVDEFEIVELVMDMTGNVQAGSTLEIYFLIGNVWTPGGSTTVVPTGAFVNEKITLIGPSLQGSTGGIGFALHGGPGGPSTITMNGGYTVLNNLSNDPSYYWGDVTNLEFDSAGQAMTKFRNPLYWRGWKRTISFPGDTDFNSRTGETSFKFFIETADNNKVLIGDSVSETKLGGNPTVNEFNIDSYVGVKWDFAFIRAKVTGASQGAEDLSEEYFFKSMPECRNPVMVEWLNSWGGYDQHLFSIFNRFITRTDKGQLIKQGQDNDISQRQFQKTRYRGPFRQQLILKADKLTEDQLYALREIKDSNDIRVFLDKEGKKFLSAVPVQDYVVDVSPRYKTHDFSVTLELPDDIIFYDVVQY